MKATEWYTRLGLLGLGCILSATTGCQTWMAGMTLPSGRYLDHRPQYFAPEPDFPLQRELATMRTNAGLANPAAVPGQPLPGAGPVPVAPVGPGGMPGGMPGGPGGKMPMPEMK
jgi:hypothetical protein